MDVEEILAQLVAFESVVGQSNGSIVDWVRTYCEQAGAQVVVLPGPEGDRFNTFVSVGPRDRRGTVFSGHLDVVPAGEPEWKSNPFLLRREGRRLIGRGTTDMKGFVACLLAELPGLAAASLVEPVHFALSYDEEAGCRGVPHLIAALPSLCERPLGAIIGEPSQMRPVLAHKGKAAARLEIIGRTGHSSRPDLGLNAVHAMAKFITQADEYGQMLKSGPQDHAFEPPYSSLQVGVIRGGQAVNIIPDRCVAEIEVRAVSGVEPQALLEPLKTAFFALHNQGYEVHWHDLSSYPALAGKKDNALSCLLAELTGQDPLAAVSFGTEAGLYQQAGIDSIICGPGHIDRAHKPNEFIEIDELHACRQMIQRFAARITVQ